MSKLYDNWNKFQCLSLRAILHFRKVKKDSMVNGFFPFLQKRKCRMYPVSMNYSTPLMTDFKIDLRFGNAHF